MPKAISYFGFGHPLLSAIFVSVLEVGFKNELRSEEKKSAHVFVCITRIMLGLDKNQSNQQKVHILRIPNW